jgi:multiple sugar transport system substrate-binding protein
MTKLNRRDFLESSAGVAAASTTLGMGAMAVSPAAQAQSLSFKPEKGAKLRVLRWSRFVQGDIDAYMANVKKFTELTGVEVRVRQRRLGRRSTQGRCGSQHRRRPRHHFVDQ